MLASLARFSFKHRRMVVGAWLMALVFAVLVGPALAGKTASSGRLPNTDSQRAYDTLAYAFPNHHGDDANIVFADPDHDRAAIASYLGGVARVPGVIEVAPLRLSVDGRVAVSSITIANDATSHPRLIAGQIIHRAKPFEAQGMRVAFAGEALDSFRMPA